MKTEDILKLLSFFKNGASDLISILDDVQLISKRISTIAKDVGEVAGDLKHIMQRVEGIVKKVEETK